MASDRGAPSRPIEFWVERNLPAESLAPEIQLEIQQVVEGALDLPTEDSLLPNVPGDEEIWIRQGLHFAVHSSRGVVGLGGEQSFFLSLLPSNGGPNFDLRISDTVCREKPGFKITCYSIICKDRI